MFCDFYTSTLLTCVLVKPLLISLPEIAICALLTNGKQPCNYDFFCLTIRNLKQKKPEILTILQEIKLLHNKILCDIISLVI